jgi:hypothetical protein
LLVNHEKDTFQVSKKAEEIDIVVPPVDKIELWLDIAADVFFWITFILISLAFPLLGGFNYIPPAVGGLLMFVFLLIRLIW